MPSLFSRIFNHSLYCFSSCFSLFILVKHGFWTPIAWIVVISAKSFLPLNAWMMSKIIVPPSSLAIEQWFGRVVLLAIQWMKLQNVFLVSWDSRKPKRTHVRNALSISAVQEQSMGKTLSFQTVSVAMQIKRDARNVSLVTNWQMETARNHKSRVLSLSALLLVSLWSEESYLELFTSSFTFLL